MSIKKDIIIIGGGASGMFAAIKAKENNPKMAVAILEKQSRVGRKLLSTGNGRCNLTNIDSSKADYHGSFKQYVDAVFEKCPPARVINEFEKIGLVTRVESEGRVYPASNHAGTVLDVLRFRLEALGVEILCDTKVTGIKKHGNYFEIDCDTKRFNCTKIIICTGSLAAPMLGGNDSGISILKGLGHRIAGLSPALCPVKVDSKVLSSLKGIRAYGKATLFDGENTVREEKGEIQFTDRALSGICLFNLSTLIKNTQEPIIKLDLMPELSEEKVINILKRNKKLFGNRTCEDFLTGIFNKRLSTAIMKEARITPLSRLVNTLSEAELEAISAIIKGWSFKVKPGGDFSSAQVCSGGVIGSQINPHTMESLLIKNLFICGEAVDIDGDCGGYNLQFAFASGITAGENV